MASLSAIAVSLRNKALITPGVLSSVPARLIHVIYFVMPVLEEKKPILFFLCILSIIRCVLLTLSVLDDLTKLLKGEYDERSFRL